MYHSGIRIKLFGSIYNTEDLDLHHERFDCNLGFPFPWLDILHSTYRGSFWGKYYKDKAPPSVPGYTDNAIVLGDSKEIRITTTTTTMLVETNDNKIEANISSSTKTKRSVSQTRKGK